MVLALCQAGSTLQFNFLLRWSCRDRRLGEAATGKQLFHIFTSLYLYFSKRPSETYSSIKAVGSVVLLQLVIGLLFCKWLNIFGIMKCIKICLGIKKKEKHEKRWTSVSIFGVLQQHFLGFPSLQLLSHHPVVQLGCSQLEIFCRPDSYWTENNEWFTPV